MSCAVRISSPAPIHSLEDVFDELNARVEARRVYGKRWRVWSWQFLPYCFRRLNCGRWLPLNRDYKPLGGSPREWVDYEAFAHEAIPELQLDLAGLRGDQQTRFLYDDGSTPRGGLRAAHEYRDRLQRVIRL